MAARKSVKTATVDDATASPGGPQRAWAVEWVPVDALVEDPRNARAHGERNLAVIEASLREHGQVEPLLVRRGSNVVIAGNARLSVLRKLGVERAACHVVDLTDEQATRLGLVMNRSGDLAEWDLATLQGLLVEDEAVLAGLFDDDELARLLDGFDGGVEVDLAAAPTAAPASLRAEGEAGGRTHNSPEDYLAASIKKMEWYVTLAEWDEVAGLLAAAKADMGLETNSEVIIALLRARVSGA
jgi:hypothetical protein